MLRPAYRITIGDHVVDTTGLTIDEVVESAKKMASAA